MCQVEVEESPSREECSWHCFWALEVEMLARPAGASEGLLVGMAFQMGVGLAPTI